MSVKAGYSKGGPLLTRVWDLKQDRRAAWAPGSKGWTSSCPDAGGHPGGRATGSVGQLEGLRGGDWQKEISRWSGADSSLGVPEASWFFQQGKGQTKKSASKQGLGQHGHRGPGDIQPSVPWVCLTTMRLTGVGYQLRLPGPKEAKDRREGWEMPMTQAERESGVASRTWGRDSQTPELKPQP